MTGSKYGSVMVYANAQTTLVKIGYLFVSLKP
jgi:hypothetical protein